MRIIIGVFVGTLGIVMADISRVFLLQRESLSFSGNLVKALATILGLYGVIGLAIGLTVGVAGWAIINRQCPRVATVVAGAIFYTGIGGCAVFLVSAVGLLALAPDGLARRVPATEGVLRDRVVRAPNILLVIVDSLRQDALEMAISPELAPNILGFAAHATSYTVAQAPSSWTLPSVKAILTGRYPTVLGEHSGKLSEDAVTVAEMLHTAGYETVGISDNRLDRPAYGLAQGYEYFWHKNDTAIVVSLYCLLPFPIELFFHLQWDFQLLYRGAPDVNEAVQRWLGRHEADRPFYLMIHYMDVHYPYRVYKHLSDNYSNRSTPDNLVRHYEIMRSEAYQARPPFARLSLAQEKIDDFKYRYWGSLQYLDKYIGALFQMLKNAGQWDNTLVIVTADHGEEFFEHSYFSHGGALYQESVRVPLIVKWPGQDPAQVARIKQPVSLLQLVPTILGVTEVRTDMPFPHRPLTGDEAEPQGTVYCEFDRNGMRIYSAQLGRFKKIYSRREDGKDLHELYDTNIDRTESVNLLPAGVASPDDLTSGLEQFIGRLERIWTARGETPLSEAELEELRALGYIR